MKIARVFLGLALVVCSVATAHSVMAAGKEHAGKEHAGTVIASKEHAGKEHAGTIVVTKEHGGKEHGGTAVKKEHAGKEHGGGGMAEGSHAKEHGGKEHGGGGMHEGSHGMAESAAMLREAAMELSASRPDLASELNMMAEMMESKDM